MMGDKLERVNGKHVTEIEEAIAAFTSRRSCSLLPCHASCAVRCQVIAEIAGKLELRFDVHRRKSCIGRKTITSQLL